MKEGLTTTEVEDLYRRYGFFLRRRCRLLVRDDGLADDALQETFVNLLRRGEEVRRTPSPLRFLYRVADHACFDQLRRGKRLRTAEEIDADESNVPCHPSVEPEVRQAALQLLASFDEESQRIAVMAFVDGMSQEEIATELGYSRMTIVKRVAAIRADAEVWVSDKRRSPRKKEVLS